MPPSETTACILCYHRVSPVRVVDYRFDDWNVSPESVERHIASLAEHAEFSFVRDLCDAVQRPPGGKPLVSLTFDDGFENFHDQVLPLLERYGAKATVFVVSRYIGSDDPMPFDKWGVRHANDAPPITWQALSWPSLERCVRSGLVEIGGHSHDHHNGARLSAAQLADEAGCCREVLTRRLGASHVTSYAYPYGSTRLGQVSPQYMQAVRAAGYDTAVTTDLGLMNRQSDRYALPRVEAYRSDSPAVIGAKVSGSLAPYHVTDRLRRGRN